MKAILLKNGRVIDVLNKRIEEKDVLISGSVFADAGSVAEPGRTIDLAGAYVAPGLIDGHIHIESSMLTPVDFAQEAVKNGTTSLFVDPHEIANVLGRKGVELFLEMADTLPLTMHVGIPSCVPATHLETSGGAITLKDIKELIDDPRVYGLAEMMNFPGIVHNIGDARKKVDLVISRGKIVDGHSPGLSGEDLLTYLYNGKTDWQVRIGSDHECTNAAEALEKWEKGMYIMLRSGSSSKDLEKILPEAAKACPCLDNFGLVSDDLSAYDLGKRGHINYLVRIAADIINNETAKTMEASVIEAIAMASINHARYFKKNTGIIAPGAAADVIVFDSLENIKPSLVISRGRIVVEDARVLASERGSNYGKYDHPVIVPESLAEKLLVHSANPEERVRVISMEPDTLVTREEVTTLSVSGGTVDADPDRGVLRLAVIERHNGTGNVATGFVRGFNFKKGAMASTVAHDSHNLVVVGSSVSFMLKAVKKIKEIGGGIAAVSEYKEESLALDLGGLMSTRGIDEVLSGHDRLYVLLKEMGFDRDPFPMLSFIALPVIPKLKITDRGLVDVGKFDFVSLFVK